MAGGINEIKRQSTLIDDDFLISFYEMPKNDPIDIKLEEFLQENSGLIFDTDSELKQMTDALKDHTRLVKMFK
jgi:hypothetical protein